MSERRVGDLLRAEGLVTEEQLLSALELQRIKGGRIGDNLIALGYLTPEQLNRVFTAHPPPPLTVKETGLDATFVAELLLKHASFLSNFTPADLVDRAKLSMPVVDASLEYLTRQKYIEVKGSEDYTRLKYRYSLAAAGRARAAELLEVCGYVGPAPVTLPAYVRMITIQTIKQVLVNEETVRRAFADLVVSENLLRKLGPAISSGKSLFVYGPPGNGKTTIAETIGGILPGAVYVPYSILVGGQIISVFESATHRAAPPEADRSESDPRWVLCHRPVVVAGGELTLRMLDLDFNVIAKYYEAPLQMKANNGLFIVDDFGRQLLEPRQLLNRWIVPLERRTDFLSLHTGMKFEIPFDQLVVFSTNLSPEGLVDEAFLRRIRYKIKIDRPSTGEYEAIFRKVCAAKKVDFRPEILDLLLRDYYARFEVPLNACHPRDIVDHIIDEAHYRQHAPLMTAEAIASAWESHFVKV